MKKYFLVEDNTELEVGDRIAMTKPINTSYGEGKVVTEVEVTEDVLEKLVKDGFVRVEQPDEPSESIESRIESLKFYVREFANQNHITSPEAALLLSCILKVSPKAHLQLLVETIVKVKNTGETPKKQWYLSPSVNYKPVPIEDCPIGVTAFYEKADALEAYRLLLPFIKEILDGE